MGILRSDRVSGLGGANAINGSVFFSAAGNSDAGGPYLTTPHSDDFAFGSGEFTIEQWPNSKVVDVEIIWLTSGLTESILLEIETYTDTDTEAELPFDLLAAIYGTVTGLVLVMFILQFLL